MPYPDTKGTELNRINISGFCQLKSENATNTEKISWVKVFRIPIEWKKMTIDYGFEGTAKVGDSSI